MTTSEKLKARDLFAAEKAKIIVQLRADLFAAEKAKIIVQLREEIDISSKKAKEIKGFENFYTGKCVGIIHAIDLINNLCINK